MAGQPVYIAAHGARTPVGRHAAASAAACRAGLSGAGLHPHIVDQTGAPMNVVRDPALDGALQGPARLLALAAEPLAEACAPLSLRAGHGVFELPLFLALPEIRPGFTEDDARALRQALMRHVQQPCRLSAIHAAPQGHAVGIAALVSATARLRNGEIDLCLVGGIDSYLHPDTLEWLDANRQLMGPVARSGFVPGEAAGFCLLMNERARTRHGLPALAEVLPGGMAMEPLPIKGRPNSLGTGMTEAVHAALAALPDDPCVLVDNVYCDQNGERYRGEEWGFVVLRLGGRFQDAAAYHAPADCWGDVGAASGPLFAMLACQAAQRGYADGPRALLCAGSEGGLRSAVVLSRMQGGTRGGAH